MKQTIAILAVTLAVVLAVTGLIVSANLRQAELIAEKTSRQNELIGKLNKQALERQGLEEQAETLRERLQALIKEKEELALELDGSLKTVQAANDAILHLQGAGEQAEAAHSMETADLNARLEEALRANETLAGERNGAMLERDGLKQQAESAREALGALQGEVAAFSSMLRLLNALPQADGDRRLALEAFAAAAAAYGESYPHSALQWPASFLIGLEAALGGDQKERSEQALAPTVSAPGVSAQGID